MKGKKILILTGQDPAHAGQLSRSLIYSYIDDKTKVIPFVFVNSTFKNKKNRKVKYHYPIINFSKFKYRYILYNLLHLPRISYEIVKSILLDQSLRFVLLGPASL